MDLVLKHKTRKNIHNYIIANPGSNFSRIKKELNISNGTFTHHLNTLLKKGLIKEKKVKKNRKFYAIKKKELNLLELSLKKKWIIKTIREDPGIRQAGIIRKTGFAQATVSRNLKILRNACIIEDKFDDNGRRRYYLLSIED